MRTQRCCSSYLTTSCTKPPVVENEKFRTSLLRPGRNLHQRAFRKIKENRCPVVVQDRPYYNISHKSHWFLSIRFHNYCLISLTTLFFNICPVGRRTAKTDITILNTTIIITKCLGTEAEICKNWTTCCI